MFFVFRDSYVLCIYVMNVLRTGMNMSISYIRIWLCNSACFVCIVSGRCNQSFSAFLMKSSCRCIVAMFIAGRFSSSFFSSHVQSIYVISGMEGLMHHHESSCSLINLFKFFFRPLEEWT